MVTLSASTLRGPLSYGNQCRLRARHQTFASTEAIVAGICTTARSRNQRYARCACMHAFHASVGLFVCPAAPGKGRGGGGEGWYPGTRVTPRPKPRDTARMKRVRRAKPSMDITLMPDTHTLANRKVVMPPSTQLGMVVTHPVQQPPTHHMSAPCRPITTGLLNITASTSQSKPLSSKSVMSGPSRKFAVHTTGLDQRSGCVICTGEAVCAMVQEM